MAACGLRLAACSLQLCITKGTFFPDIDMVMYTAMYGRTWTRASRAQRAAGKSPSCQSVPRLAVSIRFARSQALVVSSRPVTSRVHPAARNHLFPCLAFPSPVTRICGRSTHLLSRARIQGSWRVPRPSRPFSGPLTRLPLPTHPSPNSFAAPPRPAYDAMPLVSGSGGRMGAQAWAAEYDIANTTRAAQQRCTPGSRQSRPGRRRAKETS